MRRLSARRQQNGLEGPKRRRQAPSAQSGSLHLVTEAERLLSQAWKASEEEDERSCWGCTEESGTSDAAWMKNSSTKRFFLAITAFKSIIIHL